MQAISNEYLRELRSTFSKFDLSLGCINESILWLDEKGDIEWCNGAFNRLTNRLRIEVLGRPIDTVISLEQENGSRPTFKLIESIANSNTSVVVTYLINNQLIFLEVSANKIPSQNNVPFFIVVLHDVTRRENLIQSLKKNEKEIIYLATHDMLTSLPNRREFEKVLNREIERAKRQKTIMALLFIDLDNFKHINDSLGHQIGDKILILVSERLNSSIRRGDMVIRLSESDQFFGRLGGDEFVVLLTDLKQEIDAAQYAKRIGQVFSLPFKVNNLDLYISVSIGISVVHDGETTADDLMKFADMAMYRAKETSKGSIEFYKETLSKAYKKRLEIENGLHVALEKKYFYLVYQPQYSLLDNKVRGVEALLRWKHPELGHIPPDEFIPVAEKSGLIIPIGLWVVRQACKQYSEWLSQGVVTKDLKLAINISPFQLIKEKFTTELKEILSETGVPFSSLEFEITETALMTEMGGSEEVLDELNKLGIDISIDDFGTGYSSLARIKKLPINILKIDKSFIKKIGEDLDDSIIVKSIIALAKALDLEVIAEGVEKKEHADYLKKTGCELVQGFYFSKPLTVEKIEKLFKGSSR